MDPFSSKISVVVPVYNAGRTLRQCIDALKGQTDSNYEVILVDDCSTDNSLKICKESGFKTLSLDANKGQAVARNVGARESSGEIIAFVDSDVVVPPDWLKKYRELLARYKDADMICSGYGGSAVNSLPALFAFYETAHRRAKIPLYISSSTSSNCVIYKEAFDSVNGYPEYYIDNKKEIASQKAVSTTEDSELGFLLSKKGKKIIWSHDNLVLHYFRDSWKGYLKQQIGFSRYAVLSIFRFPEKVFYNNTIYSGEKIKPQLAMISLMLLSPLGLFFGVYGISLAILIDMICLSAFYIFHRRLINYMKGDIKRVYSIQLLFWLIVSRICWLYGIVLGIRDGMVMYLTNYTKRCAK